MKPVDQSEHTNRVMGDCFEACLASVLECTRAEIPAFCAGETDEEWLQTLAKWLAPRGVTIAYVPNDPPIAPRGFHVGCNDAHAIVALDGRPIHCPHPSRAGLHQRVDYWVALVPIGGALELALPADTDTAGKP